MSPSPYMSHRGVGVATLSDMMAPVASSRADMVALASSAAPSHPTYEPVSFRPDVPRHAPLDEACPSAWPVLAASTHLPPATVPSPNTGPSERSVDEELVLLSSPAAPTPVERRVLHSAPTDDVLVSFPWGDVPFSWANGFGASQLPYDSCVDHSVMASFDDDDSPSYNKAKKSNERQQWEDAFHSEVKNLERFKVIGRKVPADEVLGGNADFSKFFEK
ncbi:hypothetical protein AB1Y20_008065 [Prymnesium parvum]|uniref:Uncharacterized protein n=1 Tax=Prymnesium parvum TaxID=97485 RepID=A0AB34IWS9_PRYPA